MAGAAPSYSGYGQDVPLRRRLTSFAFALAINLLILFGLFGLAPAVLERAKPRALKTFNLPPAGNDKPAANKANKVAAAKSQAPKRSAPKPTIEPPVIPPSRLPSNFIPLSSDEFATADVAKMPRRAAETTSQGEASNHSDDTPVAEGKGPHGETLYESGFITQPTNAQMLPYVPKGVPDKGTWADIACKITERKYLDDCIVLKDNPPGSHFGRGMTQAAFQFRVRQPRINGKLVTGAWVRLHITFERFYEGTGRP